jgi:hypothetical protein
MVARMVAHIVARMVVVARMVARVVVARMDVTASAMAGERARKVVRLGAGVLALLPRKGKRAPLVPRRRGAVLELGMCAACCALRRRHSHRRDELLLRRVPRVCAAAQSRTTRLRKQGERALCYGVKA